MFLSFNRKDTPREEGRMSVSELSSGGWDGQAARSIRANSVGTRGHVEGDWNDAGTGGELDLFLRFRLLMGRLGERGEAA